MGSVGLWAARDDSFGVLERSTNIVHVVNAAQVVYACEFGALNGDHADA